MLKIRNFYLYEFFDEFTSIFDAGGLAGKQE